MSSGVVPELDSRKHKLLPSTEIMGETLSVNFKQCTGVLAINAITKQLGISWSVFGNLKLRLRMRRPLLFLPGTTLRQHSARHSAGVGSSHPRWRRNAAFSSVAENLQPGELRLTPSQR